jgi:two-component system, OmpR family, phosphate regulon sensor histidine kinase PhoR
MNPFHSIRWKITFAYILVLASIAALGFYLSRWTEKYYIAFLRGSLLTECRFVGRLSEPLVALGPKSVDPLAKQSGRELGHRVTIIDADGRVLGDSQHDYSSMGRHNNRPEVKQALASGFGWTMRYSSTLKTRMLYVATRIGGKEHPLGVARVSEDLSQVDHARGVIHRVFFVGALIVFVIAVLVGTMISANVSVPLSTMSAAARRFAKGNLDLRLSAPGSPKDEIDELAIALNTMASELQSSLDELTAEKLKLETVFDKADDGIIIVDEAARVRMINPAASSLLDTGLDEVDGKTVIEATFSRDIAELVDRALRTESPASLEVQLQTSEQAYVNVYVAPLESAERLFGAMIVMHDLTDLKRSDSVRRDFVANVSHELRTPLASIKAMAETIILRGKKDQAVAADFAQRVIAEADRLTAISDDLLDLAKIEAGQRVVRKEQFLLSELVDQVVSQLRPRAEYKCSELSTDVPEDAMVKGDRDAVRQILVNLVDNAVKYTPHGGRIVISASAEDERISIKVSDTGIGIPPEDLPRIFERFYRVDKARSRESGGTGLGLSIVKHLCELMGGSVYAESKLGEGTVFVVMLPLS